MALGTNRNRDAEIVKREMRACYSGSQGLHIRLLDCIHSQ
jgi:hypothetical protein